MTESEAKAIKWMKNVIDDAVVTLDEIEKNHPHVSPMLYAGRKDKAEAIIEGFEELEQYRAIGTVSEFQQLKEKATAKKVDVKEWIYTKCDCGYEFSVHHGDGYYSIPYERQTNYCPNCGQRLLWD